jgi:hypothetical protein
MEGNPLKGETMTLTKSLLSLCAALAFATGTAFANESMPTSSLETTDGAYSAQSEPMMTDPITSANTGEMMEYDVYYIVPMEVVEVEEVWLIPDGDGEMPQG